MTSENILSGLHQPAGICTNMHLVASHVDWDPETGRSQGALSLTVPALRGICQKGSQSTRGLYCLVSVRKVLFPWRLPGVSS